MSQNEIFQIFAEADALGVSYEEYARAYIQAEQIGFR